MGEEVLKVLLFPLLGGFLSILVSRRLRYLVLPSYTGEKLIFSCALLGAASWLVSSIFVAAGIRLLIHCHGPNTANDFHAWREAWMLPFNAVNVVAMLLPSLIACIDNAIYDEETAYSKAVMISGDVFEQFLQLSAKEKKLVMLTLTGGRVYVGMFTDTTRPLGERTYIKLTPFASGYRIPTTSAENPGRVAFVTVYDDTIDEYLENEGSRSLKANGRSATFFPKDMGIIISKKEIEVASRFDPVVFAFLNRDRFPDAWKEVSTPDRNPHDNLPAVQ